jgi:hypothetical protein
MSLPLKATEGGRMQEISWIAVFHGRDGPCREATPDVALARGCPPVP